MASSAQDQEKRAAAEAAVALVASGMRLGLGTGSTAHLVVETLSRRVREEGLEVVCVPTSEATAEQARSLGIPLTELAAVEALDLAIDGADEVERGSLALIKGLGGALLREKMIAQAARRFVIVVDPSKVVERLGTHVPLPVEVVRFAHEATARRLPGRPVLRRAADGAPFVTDNGNHIYDLHLGAILDAPALDAALKTVAGVVEHGLFLHGVEQVIVGLPGGGVQVLRRAPV